MCAKKVSGRPIFKMAVTYGMTFVKTQNGVKKDFKNFFLKVMYKKKKFFISQEKRSWVGSRECHLAGLCHVLEQYRQ